MEIRKGNFLMFLTFLVCIFAAVAVDNTTEGPVTTNTTKSSTFNETTTNSPSTSNDTTTANSTNSPVPTNSSDITTPQTTNGTNDNATTEAPTSTASSQNITDTANLTHSTLVESTSTILTTSTTATTTAKDYCISNPCKHGNCKSASIYPYYICECYVGWSGRYCDNEFVLWPDYKGFGHSTNASVPASFSFRTEIPFSYFERSANTLYGYNKGYVTFGASFGRSNAPIGTDWPYAPSVFGVYWADMIMPDYPTSIFYFSENYFLKINSSMRPLVEYVKSVVNESDFEPLFIGVVTYLKAVPLPLANFSNDKATVQLILATDSQFSYAIKNYQSVWKNTNTSGRPYFSTAYTGANGTRLLGQIPEDLTGNITVKLFSGGRPDRNPSFCVLNVSDVNDRLGFAIKLLPDCPCYLAQAKSDWWFELANVTTACYQSILPDSNGLKQQCCYNRFGLLNANSTEANVPVLINATGITIHAAYNQCCKVVPQLCPWFYKQFPTSNCNKYSRPFIGGTFDMMHFLTLDGNKYTFFDVGDFVLFKSGPVEVHIRVQRNGTDNTTSVEAVAVKVAENTSFQIYLEASELKLVLPSSQPPSPNSYKIDQSQLETTIFHTSVILTVSNTAGALSCTLKTNRKDTESVGLLGSADRNITNDFKFRNGTVIQGTADQLSPETILAFAQSWQVKETESLLNYSSGHPHGETINSTGFEPYALPTNVIGTLGMFVDVNKQNTCKSLCGDELFCLQECFLRNSNGSATYVLEQIKNISSQTAQFTITAPKFNQTTNSIRIEPDSYQFTLPLEVEKNETVEFSFTKEGFPDINATMQGNKFIWNIMSDLEELRSLSYPRELKFYATNKANISAEYAPAIWLCLCNKTEQCGGLYSGINDEFFPGSVNTIVCHCGERYGGKFCEKEEDVCQNCFINTTCNASRYDYCAPCPDGYGGNGKICRDNNECSENNGGCDHICTNTDGSFQCSCRTGYSQNGSKCTDINECLEDGDKCKDVLKFCTNLPGSYSCSCLPALIGQDKCIKAPYSFVGTADLAASSDQFWVPDFLNKTSDRYKSLSKKVTGSITEALISGKIGTTDTLYVEILSFRNPQPLRRKRDMISSISTISAEYVIHVANGSITADTLNNALKNFNQSNCNFSCQFGEVLLIAAPSVDSNGNLCNYPQIHKCDNTTTKCAQEKSLTSCECRSGFTHSNDPFYCNDNNECAENATKTCPDTGVCVNTEGSFECKCNEGKFWNTSTTMCDENGCFTNPCKNDGVCFILDEPKNFACKCRYGWEGHLCENEDAEANRMKVAVICVSVILGVCCLVLFIILIVICVRQHRTLENDSYSYTNSRYSEADHMPRAKIAHRPATEMTENGQGTGYERLNASRPDDKQVSFGRHSPTPGSRNDVTKSVYHNHAYETEFGERL